MKISLMRVLFCALLLIALPRQALADVSVNLPLGHWAYTALDRLFAMGMWDGGLWTTRPITRMQAARLTREAEQNLQRTSEAMSPGRADMARGLVQRLKQELDAEMLILGGQPAPRSYFKPIEDLYVYGYHGKNDFALENDEGRTYGKGTSIKVGLSAHGVLLRHLGFYINPEFRRSKEQFGGDDSRLSLLQGYAKLEWANLELEAGRDSMWWGPGRRGSFILTNNAKPFDLLKLQNPTPVVLPWVLRYLGLFQFTAFYTKLEGSRYVPEPELMGGRVTLKPFPFLELGLSRTVMLGGHGPRAPKGVADMSLRDWIKVFSGRNISGPLDTNQIGGGDFLLHFRGMENLFKIFSTLDIWGEIYGEDEAANLPSRNGHLAGLRLGDLFLQGSTDLTVEYADNVIRDHPLYWYNHHIYRSGYTYDDRVMGHEMGSGAQDLWVHLTHQFGDRLWAGLSYNRTKREKESEGKTTLERYTATLTYWLKQRAQLEAGWRLEDGATDPAQGDRTNHILWAGVNYSF